MVTVVDAPPVGTAGEAADETMELAEASRRLGGGGGGGGGAGAAAFSSTVASAVDAVDVTAGFVTGWHVTGCT